jgi:hypothetical protein
VARGLAFGVIAHYRHALRTGLHINNTQFLIILIVPPAIYSPHMNAAGTVKYASDLDLELRAKNTDQPPGIGVLYVFL